MPSIFKIRDKITGRYIKSIPWQVNENTLDQATEKDKGRIFKRRCDASIHITSEKKFYRRFYDRFEVVELEIKEEAVNVTDVSEFVDAIEVRAQKRADERTQRDIQYKQKEIRILEEKLKSLKGK